MQYHNIFSKPFLSPHGRRHVPRAMTATADEWLHIRYLQMKKESRPADGVGRVRG